MNQDNLADYYRCDGRGSYNRHGCSRHTFILKVPILPGKQVPRRRSRWKPGTKWGASGKSKFNDNSWFVGMTPRRNPEIVDPSLPKVADGVGVPVARGCKVIKAYVDKQREFAAERKWRRPTAALSRQTTKQAQIAAVWHEGDAKTPDRYRPGQFTLPSDKNRRSL